MLSLSDNEFAVINFLVRNFSERLTVRSIAKKLNFSPAGVYNILKKLEQQNIVFGEKLGTGLFFKINLENIVAKYLSLAVLVGFFDYKIDLEKYRSNAKAAFYDKKNVLIVVENHSVSSNFEIDNANVIVKKEDEFVELLRKKDLVIFGIIKNSTVVFGEEFVIEVIKKFVDRF